MNAKTKFKILELLRPPGKTAKQIARSLGVSDRQVYRYFQDLHSENFDLEKDEAKRYFAFNSEPDKIPLTLLNEEAEFISDLLAQFGGGNPLSEKIQTKLFFRSGSGKNLKSDFRKNIPEVIRELSHAMKLNRQVRLETYFSASTGHWSERVIEPLDFSGDYRYLIAYEAAAQKFVNLKLDRIKKVVVLENACTQSPDNIAGVDVFQIAANNERHELNLRLNALAYRLLLEEYPAAEPFVSESGDPLFPYRFSGTVYNLLPVTRFCLGLPGAIVVDAPEALLAELHSKSKNYTWIKS